VQSAGAGSRLTCLHHHGQVREIMFEFFSAEGPHHLSVSRHLRRGLTSLKRRQSVEKTKMSRLVNGLRNMVKGRLLGSIAEEGPSALPLRAEFGPEEV
jgi:hypothetical protein